MAIINKKPTSSGSRFQSVSDFKEITTSQPHKPLTAKINKSGGRNVYGRITSRYISGGHKQRYRLIDWKRNKDGISAKIETIEYDPNRSANIALLVYSDGEKRYILAPDGLKVGDAVISGSTADIITGNNLPLKNIPTGTFIHNVELKPGKGGQMVRSAGGFAQLMAKEDEYALLKMPSGETRKIRIECRATIGTVGNAQHEKVTLGKAGRTRWLGRRSRVRGTAKNPIDHPHGGGEGRTKGGRHPVTPWGKPTKGYKTRKNKLTSKYIVKRKNDK